MTKFYALERIDGGVAIMQTDADPAVEIARWGAASRALLTGAIREITEADLPTDRIFRDAWRLTGQKITHDMVKARAIHMDRIRAVRNKEIDKLDKEWTRATGQGKPAEAATIEANRQRLRDIPQTLDLTSINDTATLHNAWPAGLPKP